MVNKWISQGAKNLVCDNMPCDTTGFTFTLSILPVIQDYCKGCHSGASAGGSIQLVDYTTIKAAAQSGTLYGTITHAFGYSAMPKFGDKLPNCYIVQIRKWIAQGMPAK
jgi:mono/diheme cytochrome c family protein